MGKIQKLKDAWGLIHNPFTNNAMTGFDSAIQTGVQTDTMYHLYFSTIAQSLFKWNNLPASMDANYLEKSLFLQGRASAILIRSTGEIINTNYSEFSYPNIYDMPNKIDAIANNFHMTVKKDDFVICRNNVMFVPTVLYVNYFAEIVKDIDLTLRVNLKAQKTPTTFTGSKEQQQALENFFMKYDGNQPYIFLKENLADQIKLGCFKTDAPFIADKLTEMKKDYKNEFLTFLGVNNVDVEKKERLITDEVNANNQNISTNFETMYKCRRDFCVEFNEKFKDFIDKPISVEPAIQSQILINDTTNAGGGENGSL